jgi:transcriptional regulator NrdR family protein
MNCPNCEHDYTKVKETRVMLEQPRWSKRRRHCLNCDNQFWTVELPVEDLSMEESNEEETSSQ